MSLSILLLLSLSSAQAAKVPTAEEIFTKSRDLYNKAKSYQGTLNIRQTKGGKVTVLIMDAKATNDGKGSIAKSRLTLTSTLDGKPLAKQLIVDDGKNVYIVDPNKKTYFTRPHSADAVFALFEGVVAAAKEEFGKLKSAAKGTTYVVTGSKGAKGAEIVFDQKTFKMISARSWQTAKQPVVKMTVTKQVFGGTISEASFNWVPPVTYEMVKPGGS